MSISTGRFIVTRDGVPVEGAVDYSLGPAIAPTDVAGADATATWSHAALVRSVGTDYTTDALDGQDVTVDWVDDDGVIRVFTGSVADTRAETTGAWSSRLSDGTLERLTRRLDLRPMAWSLPVNATMAGKGGRIRHVGLQPIWFVHQAMTQAGYDPGVPMHTSCVWYQSMCGSVATVPGRHHAWAPLGDLRTAHRPTNADAAPGFVQGDTQWVARDVFTFGTTDRPRPGMANLPWQVTFDIGIRDVNSHPHGSEGEILLRDLSPGGGVALVWDKGSIRVERYAPGGARTTHLTVPRAGEDRWTLVLDGTQARLRSNISSTYTATMPGLALPTGADGLCSVRVTSPGVIGPVAVSRGDRPVMVEQAPTGHIIRATMSGYSLPGWLHMPDLQAGRVLVDQAQATRGLRGQPVHMWIDGDGVLQNTDFDTLARQDVALTFDVRPGAGGLALDSLAWQTDPPGGPWSAVRVTGLRSRVLRSDTTPRFLLAEGARQTLERGDDYEQFLQPEAGTAWLEPDLRPTQAGFPYPSPPYPGDLRTRLDRGVGTILGGHKRDAQSGDRRGWLQPSEMGWSVNPAGHVTGALEMLTPDRVLISGTVAVAAGLEVQTIPNPASAGLPASRREQPLPVLRGWGRISTDDLAVEVPVAGVDSRHEAYTHDVGMWVQQESTLARMASDLHATIADPTPVRTATVQLTGRCRPGMKVELIERRPDGVVVTEHVVVARLSASTAGTDEMTITGQVVYRSAVQTDPDGPPVDEQDDWTLEPPLVDPDDPRETDPPWDEDEPGQDGPPAPPVRPSTPTATVDLNTVRVRWNGLASTGAPLGASPDFGTVEVEGAPPGDVVGEMAVDPDVPGGFLYVHGPVELDSTWTGRIRVIDRWGQESPWSDPVDVVVDPLVDPRQFEDALDRISDAEEGLDALAADLAAGGYALADPEFTDPAAWTAPAAATWLTDLTDHPYGRTTGVRIPAGAGTVATVEPLPTSEGQEHWAAVLVRAESATTSTVQNGLEVQWVNEAGAQVAVEWVDARPLRDFPAGEWLLLSGYATAPAGAVGARFRVRRTSGLAPAWTLASARLLRSGGGIADPVALAGFIRALVVDVGQLVVTEGATINEAVILRLAAELAEFIEVRAENILAGDITSLLRFTAQGEAVFGHDDQVHVRIHDGRVDIMHPGEPGEEARPYISMGKGADGAFRVLDASGGVLGGIMPDGGYEGPRVDTIDLTVDGRSLDERLAPLAEALGRFQTPPEVIYGPTTVDMALVEVTVDVPASSTLILDVHGWLRAQAGTMSLLRCSYNGAPAGSTPPRPTGASTEIDPALPVMHHTSWSGVMWRWTLGIRPEDRRVRALIWASTDPYGREQTARAFTVMPSILRLRGASGFAGVIRATPGGGDDPAPAPPLAERTERFDLGPHSLWTGNTRWTFGYRFGDVQAGRGASGQVVETAILMPATARSFIAESEEIVSARVRLAQSVYPTNIRPSLGTIQSTNITGTRAGLGVRNIGPGSRTYTPAHPSGWTYLAATTLAALMAGDPGLWITHPTSGPAGRFHGPGASGALRPQIEITTRSRT